MICIKYWKSKEKLVSLLRNLNIQVSEAKNCLEDSTMSNPVHTSETRMCGDIVPIPPNCLEGST